MQANVIKREMLQRKTLYEGKTEIGIESDIVLPDYCKDIERILRCSLTPRLSSKRAEGDRLSVEAIGFLRMIYLSTDGSIGSFETQIPFSKLLQLPSQSDKMSVEVKLFADYSNCRAVSARRFEVRAAVVMRAKVVGLCSVPIVMDIGDDMVEMRKSTINAVVPVCSSCESFTVMEEYELQGESIGSVLKMNAVSNVLEYKIVSGKVIMKGDISLDITYMGAESEDIKSVSYNIPVNQVLSADGAQEDDNVTATLTICTASVEPVNKGDKSEIRVEILLEACAEVSRNDEICAITDAYCVGFNSKCSFTEIPFTIAEQTAEKTHNISVPLEVDGAEIIDVLAECKNMNARVNDVGEVMLSSDVTVSVLCRDTQGEVFVRDKVLPIEFSLAADPLFVNASLDGDVKVGSVRKQNGRSEAALSLFGSCHIVKEIQMLLVSDVEIMSDSPILGDAKTAMTIYFAQAGEDAFDIAKRYNTSAKEVMEQNSLSEPTITSERIIIVPMVR